MVNFKIFAYNPLLFHYKEINAPPQQAQLLKGRAQIIAGGLYQYTRDRVHWIPLRQFTATVHIISLKSPKCSLLEEICKDIVFLTERLIFGAGRLGI